VAFLAGSVPKRLLFEGGAATIAGIPGASAESLANEKTPRGRLAWEAYIESAVKAVATLAVSVADRCEIILSGRLASLDSVHDALMQKLSGLATTKSLSFADPQVHVLAGFASIAKHAAQGAALIANGLAGGRSAELVATLGLRDAHGTVLDHLYVISPLIARRRLGIT
jgi:predicted butyrate kinase (DUF1464 family)